MEIIATYNDENISENDLLNFRHRHAVRCVIFDSENNIALIHAVTGGYYTLPGGGVNAPETLEDAVVRECKEEAGCNFEIEHILGKTLEYRKKWNLINETVGFLGKIIGEKGSPIFNGDEDEAEKNSVVVWFPIEKAIEIIKNTKFENDLYEAYVMKRELAFLEKAKELIKK